MSPALMTESVGREGYLEAELEVDDRGRPVDLRYLDENAAASRLSGRPGYVGRRLSDLETQVDPEYLAAWQRAIETGESQRIETYVPDIDRWFDALISPRTERRAAVVFHDVTDRKHAEAALRERETRLELALDVAAIGSWSWDLATGRGDIDERGAEIVGMQPGPVDDIAAAQQALIHPDDHASLQEQLQAGLASGEAFPLEYRVVRPDGSLRHVLSRARAITAADGSLVLIGTNRDVTVERQAVETLREREARYRTLFESMDEGFCILEMVLDDAGTPVDYRFLEVNPVFARQTGLQDAVGKTARELVPGLEPTWIETYGRVALTGEPARFTEQAPSMGRWFDVFAFRVGTPEELRVALLFNDITERKLAEEEREATLERERRGREAAEAFLAVMSHELRTPVTSIYGTATILARDPDRADLRDLVLDMQDEAERLRRIIDDLLVLSGVDRGLLRLSPEPVLFQRAAAEVVADVQRRFPTVEVLNHVPRSLPPVIADGTALRQVLYNLLTNAAKYAGADGPVTLAADLVADGVSVAILDEGPGLGDDPAALFGLFYRSPHTAKRASGTGIGLYVASELLDALGSTIEATTRPTGGASFRFTLPLADA